MDMPLHSLGFLDRANEKAGDGYSVVVEGGDDARLPQHGLLFLVLAPARQLLAAYRQRQVR